MACNAQESQQGFKCTTAGVCYSCSSPQTDALFKKLQAGINQFAASMIFTPIKVDGILGPGTTTHAKLVLSALAGMNNGVVSGSASAINAGIIDPSQLAANAQVVVDLFTLAGKTMNLAPAQPTPPPKASPSVTDLATTGASKPPSSSSPAVQAQVKAIQAGNPKLAASLLDVMPPWLAYASGALLAGGAIAAVVFAGKKRKAAAAPAPAVAGFFRRY